MHSFSANRKKIIESSTANKSRKTRVTKGEKPKFPFTVKLTGEMWMKKNTFQFYFLWKLLVNLY